MTAPYSEELISAYLDGELTPAEQVQVEHWLAESAAARKTLQQFQALRGYLRELPAERPQTDFLATIRAQINQSTASADSPPPVVSPANSAIQAAPESGISAPYTTRRLPYGMFTSAACLLILCGSLWLLRTAGDRAGEHEFLVLQEQFPAAESMMMQGSRAPELAPRKGVMGEQVQNEAATLMLAETAPDTADGITATPRTRSALDPVREQVEIAGAMPSITGTAPFRAAPFGMTPPILPADEIPPLPPLSAGEKERLLNQVVNSPKLQGKLQPGELVQLMSVDEQQVTVIELSVVDVVQSLGEVQVLLAGQRIKSAAQRNANSLEFDVNSRMTDDFVSRRPNAQHRPQAATEVLADSPNDKTGAVPQTPSAEMADTENSDSGADAASVATVPFSADDSPGLIALYVETTDTQFLSVLQQLESSEMVQQLRIGEASQLEESLYSVTPMIEETAETDSEQELFSLQMARPASPQEPHSEGGHELTELNRRAAAHEVESRLPFQLVQLPPGARAATAWRNRLLGEPAESPRMFVNRKEVAEPVDADSDPDVAVEMTAPKLAFPARTPLAEVAGGSAAGLNSDAAAPNGKQALEQDLDSGPAAASGASPSLGLLADGATQQAERALHDRVAEDSYQVPVFLRPQREQTSAAELELAEDFRSQAKRNRQAVTEGSVHESQATPEKASQLAPSPAPAQTPPALAERGSLATAPAESPAAVPQAPSGSAPRTPQRIRALIILTPPAAPERPNS